MNSKFFTTLYFSIIVFLSLFIFEYWGNVLKSSYYLNSGYNLLKGNKNNASVFFNKSIKFNKYNKRAYFYLSYLYLKDSNYIESEKIFNDGLPLNFDPSYYYNMSVLYKNMNKIKNCSKYLKISMFNFPLYLKNWLLFIQIDRNNIEFAKEKVLLIKKLMKINGELNTEENRRIINLIEMTVKSKEK